MRALFVEALDMQRCMNNNIYSTLVKTQERKSDRSSKEIEQRKESQKIHTHKQNNKDM